MQKQSGDWNGPVDLMKNGNFDLMKFDLMIIAPLPGFTSVHKSCTDVKNPNIILNIVRWKLSTRHNLNSLVLIIYNKMHNWPNNKWLKILGRHSLWNNWPNFNQSEKIDPFWGNSFWLSFCLSNEICLNQYQYPVMEKCSENF